MALVKCPECGRENVSDSAVACPECGFSIKKHFEKIEEEKKIERENEKKRIEAEKRLLEQKKQLEEKERNKQNRKNYVNRNKGKIILLVAIFVVVVGILIGVSLFVNSDEFKEMTDDEAPELIVHTNVVPWLSKPNLLGKEYVEVVDNVDDNPKVEIVEGSVDSSIDDIYLVKYKVSDQSGNSEIIEVRYLVNSGLPKNCTEETRALYASIQGVWCAEALWTNNDVKKMIQFEGTNFIYRDSNGIEYKGSYSISESTRPTYEYEEQTCLFCISLPNYTKSPANLFFYEDGSISDRFANNEWFEDYSIYKKTNAKMMEGSKTQQNTPKRVEVTGVSSKTSGDNYVVSGTVKNTTDRTVYFVKVKVTLQNDNGEVINTDNTYAVGDEGLAPGESSTFSCYIDMVDGATTCSAQVYDYQY